MAPGGESLSQELDVPQGQVEPRHRVAAIGEAHQVWPGAAGDVDDPADGSSRKPPEAVDEEVDLALAVEVERDLVEARRAVLPDAAFFAKPQRDRKSTRLNSSH